MSLNEKHSHAFLICPNEAILIKFMVLIICLKYYYYLLLKYLILDHSDIKCLD